MFVENAENKNEGHDGKGADGEIEDPEKGNRAEKRDGDAGGHPHGQPKAEEKGQDQDDKQQASDGIGIEGIQPDSEVLGCVGRRK